MPRVFPYQVPLTPANPFEQNYYNNFIQTTNCRSQIEALCLDFIIALFAEVFSFLGFA